MVPDETFLLRLVWHPAHFDNGELQGAAFDRQDLSGKNGRYVSVDREDKLSQIATDHTIKCQGKKENRHEALFIQYLCSDVRFALDTTGARPFSVTPEPILEEPGHHPANPGHCGVRNSTGKKSASYTNQLRTILLEIRLGLRTCAEVFSASD